MGFKNCVCGKQTKLTEYGAKLIFLCSVCNIHYDVEGKDTLLFVDYESVDDSSNTVLRNAANDITNVKKEYKCDKCPRTISTFVQLGYNAASYYCCKCGNIVKVNV